MALHERHAALLSQMITASLADYREYFEVWRVVEAKAQSTVGICGIFLAAIFAFSNDLANKNKELLSLQVLLTFALGFLILAIIFALFALRLRYIPPSPTGASLELIDDLLRVTDEAELDARTRAHSQDQHALWTAATNEFEASLRNKSQALLYSQTFLTLGIVTVCVLTLMRVL